MATQEHLVKGINGFNTRADATGHWRNTECQILYPARKAALWLDQQSYELNALSQIT
jgi:hypothetical protein